MCQSNESQSIKVLTFSEKLAPNESHTVVVNTNQTELLFHKKTTNIQSANLYRQLSLSLSFYRFFLSVQFSVRKKYLQTIQVAKMCEL